MKRIALFCTVLSTLLATPAFALDVDTFETYGDSNALLTVWSGTGGFLNESAELVAAGGASGTNNWMKVYDGGFSVFRSAPNILTPTTAGNYKLSFYYKNGIDGGSPWISLTAVLTQGSSNKVNAVLSPASNPPVVSDWTLYESPIFSLNNTEAISVEFNGNNGSDVSYTIGVDQIILTEIVNPPPVVVASPDDRTLLSRTRTITALASLGSGSYTNVTFDVGNNGSIEHTDATAPYEFVWDTLTAMPQDTSGTVDLKITLTDSASMTGSVIESYIIDNQYNGRQVLVDANMNTFQGTGFGANPPVGFVPFQVESGNAAFGPGPDRNDVADQALKVTFTAGDFTNRYALRSEGDQGAHYGLQNSFWGKGTSCRMYYFSSADNVTYATTSIDAGLVNNANWTFVVDAPATPGLTANDYVSVATHQFAAGDHFWDDVKVEANMAPPAAEVEGWNLY